MPSEAEEMTKETLQALRKSTAGILGSTGDYGVDLSGLVSEVPANVPARNNTSAFPRTKADQGALTATWRAMLNVNSSQSDAAVGIDYPGTMTNFALQNCFAPFVPLAKAGRVTLDAQALARGFNDALTTAELGTLVQLFLSQDMHIVNSQAWSVGTPSAPTLTTATTGGSIAASTNVYMKVAIRSGANYFVGGSSIASAYGTVETGSGTATNTVTAVAPAVKGGAAFDWYAGATSGGTYYYVTTTYTGSCTITAIPSANASLPTTLPLLSTTAPTAVPTADTSYSANWYNGVVASSLGDYGSAGPVTPGNGTPTACTFIDNGGSSMVISGGDVDVLDKLNAALWASTQLSPTAYMMNSIQAAEISKGLIASTGAVTFLPPTDADARTNLAGGGYIGRYINQSAGGVPVPIEVHPHVAPGTIIARTDHVPFPGSNIGSVYEVRCQYDTMRFDYAANFVASTLGGGPRFDFEIRSMETLINRAPGAQAIATNVA